MAEVIGLFLSALIAATLIPAQSEAVLVALLVAGKHAVGVLLAVATVGNVAVSALNWLLGRYLTRYAGRRWFPVSNAQLERAASTYARWGHWSLLGAWLPVIGDPLTVAAGFLHTPFWRFLVIVTLAKGGRYAVLAWATLSVVS